MTHSYTADAASLPPKVFPLGASSQDAQLPFSYRTRPNWLPCQGVRLVSYPGIANAYASAFFWPGRKKWRTP
jgi:hypothetical protein